MKPLHVLLALVLLAAVSAFLFYRVQGGSIPVIDDEGVAQPPIEDQRTLTVDRISTGPIDIAIEVAQTENEIRRGLSYRQSLAENAGMLFLFPTPEIQSFWMHGMQFPLDMIFIRDKRIIDIQPHIPPPDQTNGIPAVVQSRAAADIVLEINAGKAEEWGLNPGMEVTMTQK